MPFKNKPAPKPVRRSRRSRKTLRQRWPAVAAVTITLVMLAGGALASVASVPVMSQATPAVPASEPVPVPKIGEPYLADIGNGRVARITIKTAAFTSPAVLTLDLAWESYVGATFPDPMHLTVLDGTGKRAPAHKLTTGGIEYKEVQPNTPAYGLVAFDITSGPATLVLKPVGATQETRITLK